MKLVQMHWRTATAPSGSSFEGFIIDVESGRRPGLVLEYGGEGRLRLRRGDEPILWARVDPYYRGVWLLRRRAIESLGVVPPITAGEARSTGTVEGWMKWMIRRLDESPNAPLRGGEWRLTELRPARPNVVHRASGELAQMLEPVESEGLPSIARFLEQALLLPRAHFEPWGINGTARVVASRAPSDRSSGRIKSWRKHAREGTLPPILLWWVTALDMHVILDGHDRLEAAIAERVKPPAVTLWEADVNKRAISTDWQSEAEERYEKAFEAQGRLSDESRVRLNRLLVDSFRGWPMSRTSATARSGLREIWDAEVYRELEDDPELAARICA